MSAPTATRITRRIQKPLSLSTTWWIEHQFKREENYRWLKVAETSESIVKAMSRPAEKVKPWYEYRKHFISERRIKGGVKFWQDNKETLERAQRELGVEPAIIVSIIGVETNYGSNTGSYKVVDALSNTGL